MADTIQTAPVLSYATPAAPPRQSDWSPLRNPVFLSLWLAATVSYVGFEIRNYAAPLWMLDAGQKPAMAALPQTASTIAIPFLVLVAGALADVLDRRKLLIVTHLWMMSAAGLLGVLTLAHQMTPWLLLAFLFVIGAGYAMANPALLAVLPETVGPGELKSAMALNSVSLNVARVLGPAVGGVIMRLAAFFPGGQGAASKGAAFLATGVSVAGVVWVLARWKPATRQKPAHPESVWGAVKTGFRYAWHTPRLRSVLLRVLLFIVCAGVLGLFASIIGRRALHLTDGQIGAMMSCMGVGAIIGVFYMQPLQRKMGVETTVAICSALFAAAMLGVAFAPSMPLACVAMIVAGFNWVIVPTSFNIATQLAVPPWIKGRAMGMYVLVLQGSLSLGPVIFGRLANSVGPRKSLMWAAIGVLAGLIATIWFRLSPKQPEDVSPAKPGPLTEPVDVTALHGNPLAVRVEYNIPARHQPTFHQAMRELRRQRLRNGATKWDLIDGGDLIIETFQFTSWRDRVRHHERTTKSDAELQQYVMGFHQGEQSPTVAYTWLSPTTKSLSLQEQITVLKDHVVAGTTREFVRAYERFARDQQRRR